MQCPGGLPDLPGQARRRVEEDSAATEMVVAELQQTIRRQQAVIEELRETVQQAEAAQAEAVRLVCEASEAELQKAFCKKKLKRREKELEVISYCLPKHSLIGEEEDSRLVLAEVILHILKRNALGLRDHQAYPNKLKGHHEGKEAEDLGR